MNNLKTLGLFFTFVGLTLYYISKNIKPLEKEIRYVKMPTTDPYELQSERYKSMFSS